LNRCPFSGAAVFRREKNKKIVVISANKSENGFITIRRNPGNEVRWNVDDYFLEFRMGI
jgi:hypothetical protein